MVLATVIPHLVLLDRGVSVAVPSAIHSGTDKISPGLAVAWSTVMIFDLIVVLMTLVRTIKINRSGKHHALTRVLMRDGKGISWGIVG